MATKVKPLTRDEAVRFFQRKGLAVGFNWRDIWQQEHAVAFTVAKAMRIDILEDIRSAVDAAIKDGISFHQFQKNLTPILKAKGWWGQVNATDPLTGEIVEAQLGSRRRLKTIFDTNLRMAHSAGRWGQIQRLKDRRPYLRYIAVLDGRTRDEHRAWHGMVLPVDHPFWKTHYPPNGWHCRCIIQQLSERDIERFGYEVSPDPAITTRPYHDTRNDRVISVPEGISPGFAYNVGEARLRAFTPPPVGGGTPRSFPPGVDLPPLPAARRAAGDRILPDDLSDAEYIRRFTREFDDNVFTDKAGERLVITEDLFRDGQGRLKVSKHQRAPYLLLLADTIKEPDEIWWFWEEGKKQPGTWLLRRRYVARWEVAGNQQTGVTVFEWGQDGWSGITTFSPGPSRPRTQDNYVAGQRSGTLAYRRQEKSPTR